MAFSAFYQRLFTSRYRWRGERTAVAPAVDFARSGAGCGVNDGDRGWDVFRVSEDMVNPIITLRKSKVSR